MYERMLNKKEKPSFEEMAGYCGENKDLFISINKWLEELYLTETKIVFPYGNHYGWGVEHRNKKQLICNVFAESRSFSIMMRLTNKQYDSIYEEMSDYTKKYIDDKYPCSDGGWIHYRVICKEQFYEIQKLLSIKLSK